MDVERRFIECRADASGVVTGIAVHYGRQSRIGRFSEAILAGAFGDLTDDIRCNLMHERSRPLARNVEGGGLSFDDNSERLSVVLELPEHGEGRSARELLQRRVLSGFSVEMIVPPGGDVWVGQNRTIRKAKLVGLALVDTPAHDGAIAELESRLKREQPVKRRRFFL